MSNPYLHLYRSNTPESEAEVVRPLLSCREEMERLCADSARREVVCDCLIIGCDLSSLTLAYQAALGGLRVLLVDDGHERPWVPWRIPFARFVASKNALAALPSALVAAIQMQAAVTLYRLHGVAGGRSWFQRALSFLRAGREGIRTASTQIPNGSIAWLDLDTGRVAREMLVAARREGLVYLGSAQVVAVEPDSHDGTYICEIQESRGAHRCLVRCGGIITDGELATIPFGRLRRVGAFPEEDSHDAVRVVCHIAPNEELDCAVEAAGESYRTVLLSGGVRVLVKLLDSSRAEVDIVPPLQRGGVRNVAAAMLLMWLEEGCRRSIGELQGVISARYVTSGVGPDGTVFQRGGVIVARATTPWSGLRVLRKVGLLLEEGKYSLPSLDEILQRPLPGRVFGSEEEDFHRAAATLGVSSETTTRVWKRWRGRVRELLAIPEGVREVGMGLMRGEVELVVRSEHSISLEGVVFDALQLQEYPQWEELVPIVGQLLGELRGWEVSESEVSAALDGCRVHLDTQRGTSEDLGEDV